MSDEMYVIVEDVYDEYEFDDDDYIMSGTNINTTSYGLFLVAKELTLLDKDHQLLTEAINTLDKIPLEELEECFGEVFPPQDLSCEGILNLAQNMLSLYAIIVEQEKLIKENS